jgi:ABC-type transport system involved in multi-copper enzyme maturation permease subunit
MKTWQTFRFELAYQVRRPWPWLGFAALFVFTFLFSRDGVVPVTLVKDFSINAPFVVTAATVITSLLWLLVAAPIAGEAAARDVQTRMDQLLFTSPVGKAEHLAGRWLAAVCLNAFVLLGTQAGAVAAVLIPGVAPEIVAPLRLGTYAAAFAYVALPNALVGTTMQFAVALWSGRPIASWFASFVLLFLAVPVSGFVAMPLGLPTIGRLTDPMGFIAIWNSLLLEWTIAEKYTRAFTLEGAALYNRLVWLGIAAMVWALVYTRFRFAYRTPYQVKSRWFNASTRQTTQYADARAHIPPVQRAASADSHTQQVPIATRGSGVSTRWLQLRRIATMSAVSLMRSPAGLFLLTVFPAFLLLVVTVQLRVLDVPILPRTGYLLSKYLTGATLKPENFWLLVPLLILYFAGELLWRERDARLADAHDTVAVPPWVPLAGKFIGLALVILLVLATTMAIGLFTQVRLGYARHELGLFTFVLFGLQFLDYLLLAALAFAVHTLVNQKYGGHLLAVVCYVFLLLAPRFGVEHPLLRYASSPPWSYTDLRGFGASLGPWSWFHVYWTAWAMLLLVGTTLLWPRGRETAIKTRLLQARARFRRGTLGLTALGSVGVAGSGAFIFYNTNVLHVYRNSDAQAALAAEYERRFGAHANEPQPSIVSTRLEADLEPSARRASVRGTYVLHNRHPEPIRELHIERAFGVRTTLQLSRTVQRIDSAPALGHEVHVLATPLAPGDTLTLSFQVRAAPSGFRHTGAVNAIAANGTHITSALLPSLGYQPLRELMSPDDRRAAGLPRKVTLPTPDDVHPSMLAGDAGRFEAMVSTDTDQVVVAPGILQRSWTERGRRWFHYVSEAPIGGLHQIFSARYATAASRWRDVDISVFHHPAHTQQVDRLTASARATLEYFSTQFAPYPYRFLQFVEQPAPGMGMGVDGSGVVTVLEGATLFNAPVGGIDGSFEIAAHEVAHQWWGGMLTPAFAEGAILLSESLAWYSAMRVIRQEKGQEALRQFMLTMREPSPWPPMRTGLPLLRAIDPYAGYRRGPFAFYALSEYAGETAVNTALQRLIARHRGAATGGSRRTVATTRDLYHELQTAVPDSLHSLLHDLFETTTFWHFDTKAANARPLANRQWEVTLDVSARKVRVDTSGKETEVPIGEWVELAVFAEAARGQILGKRLYFGRHRLRAGTQRITIVVNGKPARGGVDPYNLLDWEEGDNIESIARSDVR